MKGEGVRERERERERRMRELGKIEGFGPFIASSEIYQNTLFHKNY